MSHEQQVEKTNDRQATTADSAAAVLAPIRQQIELKAVEEIGARFFSYDDHEPRPGPKPRSWQWLIFGILVVVPICAAAVYLGLIASDVYVSETRFIVRTSAASDVTGLSALVQSQGMSRAADETFAVADYMRSRDAVDYLIAHHDLKDILSRPEADAFSRFPNFFSRNTRESLYRHFRQMVDAEVEPGTGVSVLRVSAFRPQDAKATADALLASAEDLINRLNARANNDAVDYANNLVGEATKSLNLVEQGITKYRQEQKLVDVDREAVAALEMIGRLSIELAQQEATLSQQLQVAPKSPAISSLREKIKAYRKQIEELRGKVVGTSGSLAARMAPYELLLLERELAAKALGLATLNLEKARQNAQLQHLYLQVIVQANLPDQALYPKRWLWFSIVCAISLLVFWIFLFIYRIVKEHQA